MITKTDREDMKKGTLSASTAKAIIRDGIAELSDKEKKDYAETSYKDKNTYKKLYITDYIHRWNMERLIKFDNEMLASSTPDRQEEMFFEYPLTRKVSFRSRKKISGTIIRRDFAEGFSTFTRLEVLGKNIKTMRFRTNVISMLHINSPSGRVYFFVGANTSKVYFVVSGHMLDRYAERSGLGLSKDRALTAFVRRNLFNAHTTSSAGVESYVAFKDGMSLGNSLQEEGSIKVIFLKTFISKEMCGKGQSEITDIQESFEKSVRKEKNKLEDFVSGNFKDSSALDKASAELKEVMEEKSEVFWDRKHIK